MNIVHKQKDGSIHKKSDKKINNKSSTTRVKNGAKLAGVTVTHKVTKNVEGGEEIDKSLYITGLAMKPVVGTAKKTKEVVTGIRKKSSSDNIRNSNKVSANTKIRKANVNELTRKKVKNQAKKTAEKSAKKTAKETSKKIAKESSKTATKVGTTVVGSAAGPEGTLVGIAVGEKIDSMSFKASQKNRKLKFFMDKLNASDKQSDSVGKLVVSLIKNKAVFVGSKMAKYLIPAVLPLLLVVAIATGLIFSVISVLYNSPLALFLPPLSAGDTIQSVTSDYVSEFNQLIDDLITEHKEADQGKIVYVDYEGMNSTPSNYYDIMCVYMVKYGYENTATEMNDTNKENLKAVFNDMCSYTTEIKEEKVDLTTDDNEDKKTKVKMLNVKVTLKTYSEMETEYSFDTEKTAMLEELMVQSNTSSGTSMTDAKSSMTMDEINKITSRITDQTRKNAVQFALTKVGYPYSQKLRDSGTHFDCSSLVFYAWKSAGINISNGDSTTAAMEAKGLTDNTVSESDLKPGDLIFYSYTSNGRYKNISHVGMYVGDGKMVEAVDEKTGVVICNYHNGNMVMICRPGK